MTLTEYKKQSEPLPPGTVILELSEIKKYWHVEGGYAVYLELLSVPFIGTYFVLKGDTILWTIDDKGVMKNQSVFKLKEAL